ncbi:nuclear transport factor 2 family protein [Streptomyces litchfieldiae]|uniref:Nuclear transport factor 2 family protein n=1 Tax=Streptomyces litchfieldiae TaxID=3075543 RepID=A0ABU2MR60_9ACTN|nr:nuclear transport factor 2 family protein [Streptomyces sp. DSM 44938]MDT0344120.1 nuclear transport factor 2 family protein [Streptomyces sp. DSM 44938]
MNEMSSTTNLRDHVEITTLISGFFRAMDERRFDEGWGGAHFTDDLRTTTPLGVAEGADAVRGVEEAIGRFAATLHMSSDVLVRAEPGARTASASWNAHMTHVHLDSTLHARGEGANPLFTVGGVYEAELRRTDSGWRISRMSVRAVWTMGEPPVLPEETATRVAELTGSPASG